MDQAKKLIGGHCYCKKEQFNCSYHKHPFTHVVIEDDQAYASCLNMLKDYETGNWRIIKVNDDLELALLIRFSPAMKFKSDVNRRREATAFIEDYVEKTRGKQ